MGAILRIVVRSDDGAMAANIGGGVLTTIKTFDVPAPDGLAGMFGHSHSYHQVGIVGVELIPDTGPPSDVPVPASKDPHHDQ